MQAEQLPHSCSAHRSRITTESCLHTEHYQRSNESSDSVAAKVELYKNTEVIFGEVQKDIETNNVLKLWGDTGLLPLKSSFEKQMNNQPTKLMSKQKTEFDGLKSSQDIKNAIVLPIKMENTDGSCITLDSIKVDFKGEAVESPPLNNPPLVGTKLDFDENNENIAHVEMVSPKVTEVPRFPALDTFQGKEIWALAKEFELPTSEFQMNTDDESQEVKSTKLERSPRSRKKMVPPKVKPNYRSFYWKKCVVKKQRMRQGMRVKWRYVKVNGSKSKEMDNKSNHCPIKSRSAAHQSAPHLSGTPTQSHRPLASMIPEGNINKTSRKLVRVEIKKIKSSDQYSTYKFENSQLTNKERENPVWKCFTKKAIIENAAGGCANIGYIAECKLCTFTCDYVQGSAMNQMSKHLNDMHNVDAAKIRIDKKDEETMQNKMERLNLSSYAWNFFVLKDRKGGKGHSSAFCILCGASFSYDVGRSTSYLCHHLKFFHKETRSASKTESEPGSEARKLNIENLKEKGDQNSEQYCSPTLFQPNNRLKAKKSNDMQRSGFTKNDALDPAETELTREEKMIAVRKCFIRREVRDENKESKHKVAICEFCQFQVKYEYHGKPSYGETSQQRPPHSTFETGKGF